MSLCVVNKQQSYGMLYLEKKKVTVTSFDIIWDREDQDPIEIVMFLSIFTVFLMLLLTHIIIIIILYDFSLSIFEIISKCNHRHTYQGLHHVKMHE